MKKLIIIGAGGVGGFLAFNQQHLNNKYSLIGFLDDNPNLANQSKFGYKVLGTIEDAENYTNCVFLLGIAFPKIKEKIITQLSHLHLEYINYISPNAYISGGVKLGKGVIVYPSSFIDHNSKIGDYVTINACCSVGHDCILQDFVTLAPNVALAGYTQCLKTSDIGIGAKSRQNVVIGESVVVGGQAMVINNVENDSTVIGVPAKKIKR